MSKAKEVTDKVNKAKELQEQIIAERAKEEKEKPSAEEQPKQPDTQEEQPVEEEPQKEEKAEEQEVQPEAPAEEKGKPDKYEVLKGKYDNEVPRLWQTVRELEGRNKGLELLLARGPKEERATPPPKKQDEELPELDTTKFKDFDPEIQELATAYQRLQAHVRQRDAEVNQKVASTERMTQSVQADTLQTKREKVFARLREQHKDFDQVDHDPQFASWLDSRSDPITGVRWRQLVNHAMTRLDDNAVSNIIRVFKGDQRTPVDTTQKRNPLASQVSPSRSTADVVPATQVKRYTPEDMAKFYRDCADGKYAGKEKEKLKKEKELFTAAQTWRRE